MEELREQIIELISQFVVVASSEDIKGLSVDLQQILEAAQSPSIKWTEIEHYKTVGSSSMVVMKSEQYKNCTIRLLKTVYKPIYAVTIENSRKAFKAIAFESKDIQSYLDSVRQFINRGCLS